MFFLSVPYFSRQRLNCKWNIFGFIPSEAEKVAVADDQWHEQTSEPYGRQKAGKLSGGSEAQSCNSQHNQSLFHLDISYTFPDGGICHPFDFTHPGCIPFPPCRTGLSRQSCRSPKGNVSSISSSFRRQRYWTDLLGSIECCVGKVLKDGCCLQLKISLVHSLIRVFCFSYDFDF